MCFFYTPQSLVFLLSKSKYWQLNWEKSHPRFYKNKPISGKFNILTNRTSPTGFLLAQHKQLNCNSYSQ